jgi:hypothetical protein
VIPAHKARKRRGRNSSLLLQASATQAHRVSEVIAEGVNLQPKPHRGIAERRESCSVVKPNNLILSIFRHGAGPRQDRRRARRDVALKEESTNGGLSIEGRRGDMGATTLTRIVGESTPPRRACSPFKRSRTRRGAVSTLLDTPFPSRLAVKSVQTAHGTRVTHSTARRDARLEAGTGFGDTGD